MKVRFIKDRRNVHLGSCRLLPKNTNIIHQYFYDFSLEEIKEICNILHCKAYNKNSLSIL